jgi:hypothetical protein
MKYSRQDLFRFRERSLRIDSAVQQRLQSLRLCRRPRRIKAGRRHSRCTAHSTPYKCKQHQPFNFTTVGLGNAIPTFNIVLPSVSDTRLPDIGLPAACVNTGLLTYGLLNVRSLTSKIDGIVEMRRDNFIDVCCLVETWHDADDISLNRLRSLGLNVTDRSRPRLRDDLRTNYGGIIVAAASHIRVAVLPIDSPSSFEVLGVHVSSGTVSEILVFVYRPGSQRVQQRIFDELSSVLERIGTYAAPM